MRADRLLSLLMLLQARGRLTARRLSEELEVSERTIYRDVDALGAAGVPVYAERGPGGGVALLESYRTNLTGMKEGEVRALFMLSIPAALSELGVGGDLKAALLKLAAALPASQRQAEERVRQRIYLDPAACLPENGPRPHLQIIHQAVWEDRRLEIHYQPRFGARFWQSVDPYGLVAKGDAWYLVASKDGRQRVYPLASLLEARLSSECFQREPGFDLPAFWAAWCAAQESQPVTYRATIRVASALAAFHPFGEQPGANEKPDPDGWVRLEVAFESFDAARQRLLGLGGAVEVLEPKPLRQSVADFARQIVARYES